MECEYDNAINDRVARLIVTSILADFLSEAYPLLSDYYGFVSIRRLQKICDYESLINDLLEMDSINSAYLISSLYSLLICQNRRYRDGIYFTPPELSKQVIREISDAYSGDLLTAKIIDPCSGGGAFLAPFVSHLNLEMKQRGIRPSERFHRVSQNVVGVEVCNTLSKLSEAFCLIELYREVELERSTAIIKIKTADFLKKNFDNDSFDVVIGNPPFRRISASEQSEYSKEFGITRNGGSNLYGLFIQKVLTLVRPGGVVGLVIPANLFAGKRYAHLRSYIRSHADVVSIQTMQERTGVFMDVQQETAIITLKKIIPGVRRRKIVKIASVCEKVKVKAKPICRCELPRGESPWVIPRSLEQLDATKLFAKNLPRLEDYGIKIRTGSVVWNRDNRPKYSQRGSKNSCNKPCYPLIWSDCIGADGSFDFSRAKERAPSKMFVGTKEADPELLRRSAIAIKRTSNSKQARRIFSAVINSNFVQNYSAYLGENHINFLVPSSSTSTVDLELLSLILNSDPVDEAFRCLSGSSAVSKYELRRLPLPDLDYVQKRMEEGFGIGEAVRLGFYE